MNVRQDISVTKRKSNVYKTVPAPVKCRDAFVYIKVILTVLQETKVFMQEELKNMFSWPRRKVTVRIDRLGQVQGIGGSQVCVGRRDSQDEARLLADELHDHILNLHLNVGRLVAYSYFC